jgi:hypothetical protein
MIPVKIKFIKVVIFGKKNVNVSKSLARDRIFGQIKDLKKVIIAHNFEYNFCSLVFDLVSLK